MGDDDKKIIVDYVIEQLKETQKDMRSDIVKIKDNVEKLLIGHTANEKDIGWLKTGFITVGSVTLAALFNSLFQFITFRHKG